MSGLYDRAMDHALDRGDSYDAALDYGYRVWAGEVEAPWAQRERDERWAAQERQRLLAELEAAQEAEYDAEPEDEEG